MYQIMTSRVHLGKYHVRRTLRHRKIDKKRSKYSYIMIMANRSLIDYIKYYLLQTYAIDYFLSLF